MRIAARILIVCLCCSVSGVVGLFGESPEVQLTDRRALSSRSDPVPPVVFEPQDPDAWCPTGKALDSYLEARRSLPRVGKDKLGKAVAPPPVVFQQDGVIVIEDSGVILQNDRVFDLPLDSIEFTPLGDGFRVLSVPPSYEPVTVPALFTGSNFWRSEFVTLNGFTFPFGGEERTGFWVTPTNLVAFEAPTEPVKIGLCTVGCYFNEGHVLLDRLPRISPLQHGSEFYGWNAFVQEHSDRVVVTWRYDNPSNMDVQAVLFSDGRIRFNYAAVSGILHGAVVVVNGNDDFWSDLRLGGDVVDPSGDLAIAPPDGPSMDFLGATARQVGTSDLLHVEFTIAGLPPADPEQERIFYQIEIRDRPSDPEPIGSVFMQWQRGVFYWMTEPTILEGTTLKLNLRLLDLPLTDDDLHLSFITFRGDTPFEQGDSMELTAVIEPPTSPLMLDLTTDLPVTRNTGPVYEAFTLPSLDIGEVLPVVEVLFEDPTTVEGFGVFQNLWTDIFFFAGAYHAGGNAGADGIGFGSSASPRSPSLLHLNNIATYTSEEWAMTVLSHEMGHRWLYHFAIDDGGSPSRILNPAGSHPAGWVHTPAVQPVYKPLDYSVMGGSNWNDNGDGTFTTPASADGGSNGFTWHELYLIGLADPGEVSDWWYIENPSPPVPNAYWAPNDTTVSGVRVPVSLNQVIDVEGLRFPAYPDTIQDFLAPLVIVVRPGSLLQQNLDDVNTLCTLWESRFSQATNARGSIRCRFSPPAIDITTPASDISIVSGDTIGFEASATDADGDGVELRWDFAFVASQATGVGPHPVTFPTTGSYPIRLDGVDASGMLAEAPDTAMITVDCPSTPPTDTVDNLGLDKEAGEIRFTWTDLVLPSIDYVVLSSDAPTALFLPRGTAPSGSPGLLLADPTEDTLYLVGARNADGCLGPY